MPSNERSPNSHSQLSTTRTSLDVVETIRRLDGARVGELVEELGLARSTVYKHLTTLMEEQYLVREGNTYHLGLKFFELGEYVITRRAAYEIAEMQSAQLEERTGRTVDFSVEEHGRVVSLYSDLYNTTGPEFFDDRRTFYMHNTAAGKAILAEFAEERVDAVVDRWGLPAETPHTITDRDQLFEELDSIRERGYATNDREAVEGLYSIATAVSAPGGDVFGAISIDSPTYRVEPNTVEILAEELKQTATALESELAERGPGVS